MAQSLRPTNYDPINIEEKTELTADALAGQKVASITNANGFDTDVFFVIGELGAENAELASVDSIAGNALTADSNYNQLHRRGEAITKLFGDKIRIYRATNVNGSIPADGSFSLIDTISIDVDQQFTEYTDQSGSSDHWYKRTYYNSVSTAETDLAMSKAVRAASSSSFYATAEEVREEAGLTNNRWIPESIYVEKLAAAQGEVNASLKIGGYSLPLASVPSLVKNATILLAAGYLLLKEYGVANTGTNKEGNQKLEQGRALLKKIEGKSQVLVDSDGDNVSRSDSIAGYPDDTADDVGEGFMFSITDTF